MTGAQYILDYLQRAKCRSVFGYPGGAIMPLYDALLDFDIKHYLARHEQGAAFAAIGYARSTGKTGVCFGTSGPGFTNLITPIADAKLDSVPLLVITGQVALPSMGTDAFQEVDSLGLSFSVTKHSYQITDVSQIPQIVEQAYHLCQSGRPGPVLIDVPKDILTQQLPDAENEVPFAQREQQGDENTTLAAQIANANALLQSAHKPLIYLGGGVAMAGAIEPVRQFIAASQLPVVSSLKGLGTAPADYQYDLGMLGMHGLKEANLAVQECDLLLVIGARLDDRATGKLDAFAPLAKLIHIDIDAAELGKRRAPTVAIKADVNRVVSKLNHSFQVCAWISRIRELLNARINEQSASLPALAPENILNELNSLTSADTIFTSDVGQHQMWVAQHLSFASPCHHLTSGGLGTMGFGLPAAIGAQVANPQATVVNISGDGSFMMNVQELATLKRYGLGVKAIIFDNNRLGMVRQWQELFHDQRYSETDLSDNPDFAHVAQSFGIASARLDKPEDISARLRAMLAHNGPFLLHIKLNPQENVWPIVPPNTANHHMLEKSHEPHA